MLLTDRLLATVISGLVVWFSTGVISHFIKRSRVRGALLADIKLHLAGVKEQRAAVDALVKEHIKEGGKLPYPIFYFVGEYLLYKSLQKDLPEYLTKIELVKVVKFYQALWEMDVSINGLASTLAKWESNAVILTNDLVDHAKRRRNRIDSFCQVLISQEVRSICDLPDDYRSVKGAETVVA